MGVRVRLSRNVSAYLPWWAAVPAYAAVACLWLLLLAAVAAGSAVFWVCAGVWKTAVFFASRRREKRERLRDKRG